MKPNIKLLFFSVLFLLSTSLTAAGQMTVNGEMDGRNEPGRNQTDQERAETPAGREKRTFPADISLSGQLDSEALDRETGTGLQFGLTTGDLDRQTGAGFRRISPLELEMSAGRGFGSDLTFEELSQTVGHGFINELTPDEIDSISARGKLTDEQIQMNVQSLGQITAQGVRFIVDKSKFTPEELSEIEGRGTLTDIGRAPYSIQIGLFKDIQNALNMLDEIKSKGYDPYIFRTRDDDGTPLFAVRLGDYDTIQKAYAQVTHFRGKEHKEAFVTHINSLQAVQKEDLMDEDSGAVGMSSLDAIDFDRKYPEGDLKALFDRIKALENEIDKLRVESDARRQLQMTEAEARQEEEEILSAAGRDYTLALARTLSFDYSFGYSYNTYDEADWSPDGTRIKHTANHSLTNNISTRYALLDNLTFGANVPFNYKYHQLGTSGSKDVSDLGDVSLSANWQPFRAGGRVPPVIVATSLTLPTGRSPYEINPDVDLATGSGVYAASVGFTGSKKIDPAVVFGGLNYSYQFDKSGLNHRIAGGRTLTRVKPSDGIGVSMGLGYALSYMVTVNASFNTSYAFGTTYIYQDGASRSTGTALAASLNLGTGWRVTAQRTISVGLGLGLTSNATDFSFSFRIPFDYNI